jgi:hypothetical protein
MEEGVRERHGIPDASKNHPADNTSGTQSVEVTDGRDGTVHLWVGSATAIAVMTVEQARYIAKCLTEAADRVEIG